MRPSHRYDPEKESYEILKLNLERISIAIENEYAENDRRLNWFLLFQAFLFQAYATALQAITGASNKISAEVAHSRALLMIILGIGLLTSLLTIIATQAGVRAIVKLKIKRDTNIEIDAESLGIKKLGFPASDSLHYLGLMPTYLAPPAILTAWTCVIIHAIFVNLSAL